MKTKQKAQKRICNDRDETMQQRRQRANSGQRGNKCSQQEAVEPQSMKVTISVDTASFKILLCILTAKFMPAFRT